MFLSAAVVPQPETPPTGTSPLARPTSEPASYARDTGGATMNLTAQGPSRRGALALWLLVGREHNFHLAGQSCRAPSRMKLRKILGELRAHFGIAEGNRLLQGAARLSYLLLALATASSHAESDAARSGQMWVGTAAVRETTMSIKVRDQNRALEPHRSHVFPRHLWRVEGGSPATAQQAGTGGAATGASPLNAQTISPVINFTAANFSDCSGWPPDTMGPVGPAQFIIALNGRIRSFDRGTGAPDGAINANTDSFFSSVMTPGSNFTTDPRIRYDRLSGRWFITMIDVPGQQGSQPNRILIAVSDSGIITAYTVWSFYQFQHDLVGSTPNADTGNFADYPTLGIDANALYIGVDVFNSAGSFLNSTAFVVTKGPLLSGSPLQVTAFRALISNGAGPFTPQGVDNYDPAATEGYFIGINSSGSSELELRRVLNPGTSGVALSGNVPIAVPGWAPPIDVPAQGSSGTNIDGSDARLLAAHYRDGSLWTSHNVSVNGSGSTRHTDRDGVRWYQLQGIASGQTPFVAQSGTVYQSGSAGTQSYWMGTVMVSGQGHAALGCSTAGPTNYINAAATGRLAGDPPGAMNLPVSFTSSGAGYNPSDGVNPHRWGDYSFTSLDPADDMTMWTIQQWCQSSGNGYALQVAKLLAPPPAVPVACSPNTLTQGVANVTVHISGSGLNGAGFFDPGAGFSNRLAVSIDGGGIAVNRIDYLNPTNLALVLNLTSGVTPGPRTITVANPDGQLAVSSSGLLTVVSNSTNHPPTLASIGNYTMAVGMTYSYTNLAMDPDSPPQVLAFSLGAGAATNAIIDSGTGVFNWAPTAAQVGTNGFTVVVTDNGLPPLSAAQSFSIVVVPSNSPPGLSPIPDATIAVGMTYSYTNLALDPDSPPQVLTFSLGAGAATNAIIDSGTGVFSWTPTASQVGTNGFTVVVTDNGLPPLSAAQSFSINVVAGNSPPSLLPIPDTTLIAGTTYSYTNVATDPDAGQTLTFSLGPGTPEGAVIGPNDGILVWTPNDTQLGTNRLVVQVADNGWPTLTASEAFFVTVVPPPTLNVSSFDPTGVVFYWTSVAGKTYRLEYSTDLASGTWLGLQDIVAAGTNATASDTNRSQPSFYRLSIVAW